MLKVGNVIFILLLYPLFFVGCNKQTEEVTSNDSTKTIQDSINNPLPPDEPTPVPPQVRPRLVEIKGRKLTKNEIKNTIFAYNKLFFPVASLQKNFKSKKCKYNKKHCVVNRQIPFAFDLDVLKGEDPKDIVIKDMIIEMGLESIATNYKTEQFCFLELKICSGNAIVRHPTLGVPWFIKTFAWDMTFWKKGHDQTMLTKNFHETLESGKVNDGHYRVEKGQFSMKDLFLLTSDNLKEYIFLKDNIRFMVSDDTFVINPVLKIYIEDKLPSEQDKVGKAPAQREIDESQVYSGFSEADLPFIEEELSK